MTPEDNIKTIDELTTLARAFVKMSDEREGTDAGFVARADVYLNNLAIEITNYANKKLGRNLVWMDQQIGE